MYSQENFVFKGRHFEGSLILLGVRWYLAYDLSRRDLEEMIAERGVPLPSSLADQFDSLAA